MKLKNVWDAIYPYTSTKGLTFGERVVLNLLTIIFIFGAAMLVVTLIFFGAWGLKLLLSLVMSEFAAGMTSIVISIVIAISIFGAAIDTNQK